ncbi:MAG TPA: terminase family protein, partial [Candidatus Limnocylindrales bacterium]|nr:terminase family protein [Candidatus Limnocylindrales bacterium]
YRTRLHDGQARAWNSQKRIIGVLSGSQSGKTTYGPLWLKREITNKGRGDYLAVTATYDLFKLKMLPALRETFEQVYQCGRYWSGDRVMEIANPQGDFLAIRSDDPMWARIILRSADSGGGLESATAKAAWLDEAGLPTFNSDTLDAIYRRLSLSRGRILITTTPYNTTGWLKQRIYDPWVAAKQQHDEIDIVNFDSITNPRFPLEEYERARRDMPRWKFEMFYRGIFTRPAGLIYDNFDPLRHVVPRFAIPEHWPRFLGLDFGGVNTAAVFFAGERTEKNEPTGRYFAYREYWPAADPAQRAQRSAAEHKAALCKDEPRLPTCIGGSRSEGQWRLEFAHAGISILPPIVTDVEVGINRMYKLIANDQLFVFDDLTHFLDDLQNYSRTLDEAGEPLDEIDDQSSYHLVDCARYFAQYAVAIGQRQEVYFLGR